MFRINPNPSESIHIQPYNHTNKFIYQKWSVFSDTWGQISAYTSCSSSQPWQIINVPTSLVTYSVSSSPSFSFFISKCSEQWFLSRLTNFDRASGLSHLGQGRGPGEDVRSEHKQSLSLHCHWGRGDLSVCVGLRPQDKNVFDIACNCVMFTLLVSEGACISKQ